MVALNVFRVSNGFITAPYSGRSECVENVLRGSGDIGAILVTCGGLSQIDAASNRNFVQNVKARDFFPCEPFIIHLRVFEHWTPALPERHRPVRRLGFPRRECPCELSNSSKLALIGCKSLAGARVAGVWLPYTHFWNFCIECCVPWITSISCHKYIAGAGSLLWGERLTPGVAGTGLPPEISSSKRVGGGCGIFF